MRVFDQLLLHTSLMTPKKAEVKNSFKELGSFENILTKQLFAQKFLDTPHPRTFPFLRNDKKELHHFIKKEFANFFKKNENGKILRKKRVEQFSLQKMDKKSPSHPLNLQSFRFEVVKGAKKPIQEQKWKHVKKTATLRERIVDEHFVLKNQRIVKRGENFKPQILPHHNAPATIVKREENIKPQILPRHNAPATIVKRDKNTKVFPKSALHIPKKSDHAPLHQKSSLEYKVNKKEALPSYMAVRKKREKSVAPATFSKKKHEKVALSQKSKKELSFSYEKNIAISKRRIFSSKRKVVQKETPLDQKAALQATPFIQKMVVQKEIKSEAKTSMREKGAENIKNLSSNETISRKIVHSQKENPTLPSPKKHAKVRADTLLQSHAIEEKSKEKRSHSSFLDTKSEQKTFDPHHVAPPGHDLFQKDGVPLQNPLHLHKKGAKRVKEHALLKKSQFVKKMHKEPQRVQEEPAPPLKHWKKERVSDSFFDKDVATVHKEPLDSPSQNGGEQNFDQSFESFDRSSEEVAHTPHPQEENLFERNLSGQKHSLRLRIEDTAIQIRLNNRQVVMEFVSQTPMHYEGDIAHFVDEVMKQSGFEKYRVSLKDREKRVHLDSGERKGKTSITKQSMIDVKV